MRRISLLYAVAGGLIAGSLLDVLTYWLARAGPVGDGWSLRGNGALVVPVGLGPAVLAGAWAGLILRYRGAARWLSSGIGATVIGALPAVSSVLVLVIFGSSAQGVSDFLTLPAVLWPALALLLAVIIPLKGGRRGDALVHALAAMAFTIGLVVGFSAVGASLPPGSG